MITFHAETLADVIDDIGQLLELHYQELTAHKEHIKLEPDWMRYWQMDVLGKLVIFTARADGRLVGYSAFFLDTLMHYKATRVAANDVLYLHPDHRKGLGSITLVRLIKFCEAGLIKIANGERMRVLWHIKKKHDFSPILHRMGYEDEEIIVGKLL